MAQVGADLNISPRRVTFAEGERAATVYIFNQGDTPATYTVELVDRVMQPDGQIVAQADALDAPRSPSAQPFIQYTPRRVGAAGEGKPGDPRPGAPARRRLPGRIPHPPDRHSPAGLKIRVSPPPRLRPPIRTASRCRSRPCSASAFP
jgi:hypothetical protein